MSMWQILAFAYMATGTYLASESMEEGVEFIEQTTPNDTSFGIYWLVAFLLALTWPFGIGMKEKR